VYIVSVFICTLMEYISAHKDFLELCQSSRQACQGTQTVVASTSSMDERTSGHNETVGRLRFMPTLRMTDLVTVGRAPT